MQLKSKRKIQIAVLGGREASSKILALAEEVGRLIARRGATLICGGRGGVMEAASKGASDSGGMVVGILPEDSADSGNQYLDVAVATGMGVARNAVILHSADGAVAIGGKYGTLSEMAYARQLDVPLVSVNSWHFDESVITVETAEMAVDLLWNMMKK
ncbi:MAG: TIGR00725 family protein [Spirochaetes bacterium]|nr:TIGR00725 family protein [Spirochaetota bacterium]